MKEHVNRKKEFKSCQKYLIHLRLIFHPRMKGCYFSISKHAKEGESEFTPEALNHHGMK